jgi:hypothetical protein
MSTLQEEWPAPLWPYAALLVAFCEGRLTPEEMEAVYFRLFQSDDREWPPEVFEPLNEVFLDLDAWWPHGPVDDRYAITEEAELRRRVGVSLDRLMARRWSVAKYPPTGSSSP